MANVSTKTNQRRGRNISHARFEICGFDVRMIYSPCVHVSSRLGDLQRRDVASDRNVRLPWLMHIRIICQSVRWSQDGICIRFLSSLITRFGHQLLWRL